MRALPEFIEEAESEDFEFYDGGAYVNEDQENGQGGEEGGEEGCRKKIHNLILLSGGALSFQRKYSIIFPIARKSMEGSAAYPAGYAAALRRGNGYMGEINREDMLELTRRMTLKRNCFDRIAGAYLDEEGFVDGTFNKHFQKLSQKDQQANLDIAKAVPFSDTNVQLREYVFGEADRKPGSIWQLLMALKECGLKNDAMLDVFYEEFGQRYRTDSSYAIYFFHGSYDVPLKASDKESLWESEEVYQFLICAVCPVNGDYEPGEPECGFLFPAFKDRSSDIHRIDIYAADGQSNQAEDLRKIVFSQHETYR